MGRRDARPLMMTGTLVVVVTTMSAVDRRSEKCRYSTVSLDERSERGNRCRSFASSHTQTWHPTSILHALSLMISGDSCARSVFA